MTPLVPELQLTGSAGWSWRGDTRGIVLIYLLIGSQRERRALSSSARKESNLAFMAMVIGCIFCGDLLFFINPAVRGLGSPWVAGPFMGPPALLEFQAAARGEVVKGATWIKLGPAMQWGFSGTFDPSGEEYLGAWLYFTDSVSIAGFIASIAFFSEMQDCLMSWQWQNRVGREGQECLVGEILRTVELSG